MTEGTKISYTQDDLARLTKRKEYKDGWYALICLDVKTGENQSGSYFIEPQYCPLSDPEDESTKGPRRIFDRITLPIKNPTKEHKVPANMSVVVAKLTAHGLPFDEVPRFPQKEDGVYTFNGETIEGDKKTVRAALDNANVEVQRARMEMIVAAFNDPSPLKGKIVYGLLKQDGDRKRIATIRGELPEDETLVPEEEWFSV